MEILPHFMLSLEVGTIFRLVSTKNYKYSSNFWMKLTNKYTWCLFFHFFSLIWKPPLEEIGSAMFELIWLVCWVWAFDLVSLIQGVVLVNSLEAKTLVSVWAFNLKTKTPVSVVASFGFLSNLIFARLNFVELILKGIGDKTQCTLCMYRPCSLLQFVVETRYYI